MKERFMKLGNRTKTLVGAIALVVLMAVNVQVGMNDGSTTDINLLGLEASVFAPVAVGTGSDTCNGTLCVESGTCYGWPFDLWCAEACMINDYSKYGDCEYTSPNGDCMNSGCWGRY